jgi:hypothetical protein
LLTGERVDVTAEELPTNKMCSHPFLDALLKRKLAERVIDLGPETS